MSAALEHIVIGESAGTGGEEPEEARILRSRLAQRGDVPTRWLPAGGEDAELALPPLAATSHRPDEMAGFFVIEPDEDGFLVADVAGAAFGVGDTAIDAVHDWFQVAGDLYRDLEVEEQRLGPRLHRQLLFLRKIFA